MWYRSLEEEKPALLWSEFMEMVCNRFSKVGYENLVGQFNKLVQKGRVEEYITQFDELRSYVMVQEGHHRESYYIDTFISGLKEEIAQQLYNNKPSTLQEARNMARGQEYLLNVLDKRYKSSSKILTMPTASTYKGFSPGGKFKEGEKSTQSDFRKLSLDEINEKRNKGLCFHSDEKFVPGHNCRKKKLYVIFNDESDEDCEEKTDELAIIWEEDEVTKAAEETGATVSLNAITGAQGNHTLKLLGQFKNKNTSVLVDSGSTHNFISQGLVKQFGMVTSPCSFNIAVANGKKLQCKDTVDSVCWNMAGREFKDTMHVIPLGGYDIILVVKWMRSVSPLTFDFSRKNILINGNSERLELFQESRIPEIKVISSIMKNFKVGSEELYFLVQVNNIDDDKGGCQQTAPGIESLLEEFTDVFDTPVGLPPQRIQDHCIPIKDGAQPINSNSYRCPYFHKEEI